MPPLPLSPQNLNQIKNMIKHVADAYQADRIAVENIGLDANTGRRMSVTSILPIRAALKLFADDGAIGEFIPADPQTNTHESFRIVDPSYFEIDFSTLELPVRFSIDDRIKEDLRIMTGLYADIYDIENRLRLTLEPKLLTKYGDDFINSLPRSVRLEIEREKSLVRWHVEERRLKILDFSQFSHLKLIIRIPDFISNTIANELMTRLDYLNEVRTRVAHNNIIH